MVPEAAAEIQNQLAFISAVLGGFAITLVVGLLQMSSEHRVSGWAAGFAFVAAMSLLVATVSGTWGAIWLAERPDLGPTEVTPAPLLSAFRWSARSLLLGVGALLVSLGLSGWIRSRRMGMLSSAFASIATMMLLYFLIARMGVD